MGTAPETQPAENTVPWVVFQIKDTYYCVNSGEIATILRLPEYQPLPAAPDYMTGIFLYRDDVIQLLDLRTVFGLPTQTREYDDFAAMLDQRKQDHVNWVTALEHSIQTNEPFTLATDPHQCAFGRWYDSYTAESESVRGHLARIDDPHQRLHHAAEEAAACKQECDQCKREVCLKEVLRRTKEQYMPLILQLLDEAKGIFREQVFREMVLVLNDGSRLGLVVDKVISVEHLDPMSGEAAGEGGLASVRYLTDIRKSPKISSAILELDVERLLESLGAAQ